MLKGQTIAAQRSSPCGTSLEFVTTTEPALPAYPEVQRHNHVSSFYKSIFSRRLGGVLQRLDVVSLLEPKISREFLSNCYVDNTWFQQACGEYDAL